MADRPESDFRHTITWHYLRLVGLVVASTLLIALVVLASRSVTVSTGTGQLNEGPVIAIVHAIEIVGIAIEVLAIVLWLIVSRMVRRQEAEEDDTYHEQPRVHWLIKLIVTAIPLVMLGLIAYSLYRFFSTGQAQQFDFSGIFTPTSGSGGPTDRDVSSVLGLAWWEYGLSFALVVAALGAIVWAFRREVTPGAAPEEEPSRASILSHAVDLGLKDARAEQDPRKAVIAAYATMERILAVEGLPRRRTEAPLEYMSRLFAELGVSKEPIHTLTDLFEVARFSHHPVVPAMKERAITALETLRRDVRPVP